jgi:ABC-type uncharacterized transport system substrate-binding protein
MNWNENDPEAKRYFSSFVQGLAELGWTDGRNMRIDVRWAVGNVDRARMFAKGLVDLQPDVILATTTPVTAALQRETQTIPIVEPAFASFVQQRVDAVLVGGSTLYNLHIEQLAALAARHTLPAIFPFREFALAGGLMSYGGSLGYGYHQVGIYTGRILKGDKPADLPVQQITKIDLIINLKTANALGLTIPETLLAIADEVIQ